MESINMLFSFKIKDSSRVNISHKLRSKVSQATSTVRYFWMHSWRQSAWFVYSNNFTAKFRKSKACIQITGIKKKKKKKNLFKHWNTGIPDFEGKSHVRYENLISICRFTKQIYKPLDVYKIHRPHLISFSYERNQLQEINLIFLVLEIFSPQKSRHY